MKTVRAIAAAALVLSLAGCTKPGPAPEAAVPAAESPDTVAAAGAPIGDSVAVTDTIAVTADTLIQPDTAADAPADSIADSTAN